MTEQEIIARAINKAGQERAAFLDEACAEKNASSLGRTPVQEKRKERLPPPTSRFRRRGALEVGGAKEGPLENGGRRVAAAKSKLHEPPLRSSVQSVYPQRC
jgi:hypothetical protein